MPDFPLTVDIVADVLRFLVSFLAAIIVGVVACRVAVGIDHAFYRRLRSWRIRAALEADPSLMRRSCCSDGRCHRRHDLGAGT